MFPVVNHGSEGPRQEFPATIEKVCLGRDTRPLEVDKCPRYRCQELTFTTWSIGRGTRVMTPGAVELQAASERAVSGGWPVPALGSPFFMQGSLKRWEKPPGRVIQAV
jgi:hypothetical protein